MQVRKFFSQKSIFFSPLRHAYFCKSNNNCYVPYRKIITQLLSQLTMLTNQLEETTDAAQKGEYEIQMDWCMEQILEI